MGSSYKDVMKSGGLVAFVQVFQLLFAFLRNKIIAMLLGSQGFGVWSLYQTFSEMVSSFSTLGINQSVVREVAKNDIEEKNKTAAKIFIASKLVLIISLFFCFIIIITSRKISLKLFDSDSYYWGIIIVSIGGLFVNLGRVNLAVLNGIRDLKSFAKSQITAAVLGSVFTILGAYFWGANGLPFYLFLTSFLTFSSSYIYLSKHKFKSNKISLNRFFRESKVLLYVGLGFSISALIAAITTFFSRAYLSSAFSVETVGVYQACWTVSNLYIGIILTAMGVDLLPRLSKVSEDNGEVRRLVNEQIEIGLLIGTFGVVFILFFSSYLLNFLYSKEFIVGNNIIRWQVLGVIVRIIGYPFGYAIMAKKKPVNYVFAQAVFWCLDYILLVLFGNIFGFEYLGVNYVCSYLVYFLIMLVQSSLLYKFRFSKLSLTICFGSAAIIALTWFFTNVYYEGYIYWAGFIIVVGSMILVTNYILYKYMGMSLMALLKSKIKRK